MNGEAVGSGEGDRAEQGMWLWEENDPKADQTTRSKN